MVCENKRLLFVKSLKTNEGHLSNKYWPMLNFYKFIWHFNKHFVCVKNIFILLYQ